MSPWGAHSAGCSGQGSVLDALPPTTRALLETKLRESITATVAVSRASIYVSEKHGLSSEYWYTFMEGFVWERILK